MNDPIPPTGTVRKRPTATTKRRGDGKAPAPSATRRRSARATTAPAGPRRPRRVVVLSHGHPMESPAGGEIAAQEEAHALATQPSTEVILVAASANGLVTAGEILQIAADGPIAEYVVGFPRTPSWDGEVDRLVPPHEPIIEWLTALHPDELRIHHFFRIGLEILFGLRLRLPNTHFVFIAHEMMTICEANGHMVKEFTGTLCSRATPLNCSWCFPRKRKSYFSERELTMHAFLEIFNSIQAPSQFLCDRLISWGVPATRIEHVPHKIAALPPKQWPRVSETHPLKLGYIGHISPHKGAFFLLDTIESLPHQIRARLSLRIHGTIHPNMGSDFTRTVKERISKLRDCVSYEGGYQPEELPERLATLDGVVVPSLWWENAPMVITEALRYGLPVITTDTGGMGEMARSHPNITTFPFSSCAGLRAVLLEILDPPASPQVSKLPSTS